MTNDEIKIRINQSLTNCTREQLESVLRVLDPRIRKRPLRSKPVDAQTDLVELPRSIADEVMTAVKTMYPKYGLQWDENKSPLEQQIEATIERMTGGGKSV